MSLTQLHLKAAAGHRRAVKQLLEQGVVNVDCRTPRGETPLHLASAGGDAVVCERLIRAGADIYAQRHDGQTALHIAAINNRVELVRLLLKYGSNPLIADQNGRFAYHYASSADMVESFVEFFTKIRRNPQIGQALENQYLCRDIDEILSSVKDIESFSYQHDHSANVNLDHADVVSPSSSSVFTAVFPTALSPRSAPSTSSASSSPQSAQLSPRTATATAAIASAPVFISSRLGLRYNSFAAPFVPTATTAAATIATGAPYSQPPSPPQPQPRLLSSAALSPSQMHVSVR